MKSRVQLAAFGTEQSGVSESAAILLIALTRTGEGLSLGQLMVHAQVDRYSGAIQKFDLQIVAEET